jgi:hypothetical protein
VVDDAQESVPPAPPAPASALAGPPAAGRTPPGRCPSCGWPARPPAPRPAPASRCPSPPASPPRGSWLAGSPRAEHLNRGADGAAGSAAADAGVDCILGEVQAGAAGIEGVQGASAPGAGRPRPGGHVAWRTPRRAGVTMVRSEGGRGQVAWRGRRPSEPNCLIPALDSPEYTPPPTKRGPVATYRHNTNSGKYLRRLGQGECRAIFKATASDDPDPFYKHRADGTVGAVAS